MLWLIPAGVLASDDTNGVLRVVSLNQCLDVMLAPLHADNTIALLRADQHHGALEPIVRWQPDLVLANDFANPMLLRALRQAALEQAFRVEVLTEPRSWPQVQQFYRQTSVHLGIPLSQLPEPYRIASKPLPQLFNGERVLLLQANHYSFAQETLWHDLIEGTGAVNVAPGRGLVTVLPEQILRLNPDYLVVIAPQGFALANRNMLHRALAPLLAKPRVSLEPDVFGCMAQQIPAVLDALSMRGRS